MGVFGQHLNVNVFIILRNILYNKKDNTVWNSVPFSGVSKTLPNIYDETFL